MDTPTPAFWWEWTEPGLATERTRYAGCPETQLVGTAGHRLGCDEHLELSRCSAVERLRWFPPQCVGWQSKRLGDGCRATDRRRLAGGGSLCPGGRSTGRGNAQEHDQRRDRRRVA